MSSNPSWIEGIGGPDQVNEEIKAYAQAYIKLFGFPDNPRVLHPQDQYPYVITNSDLMCYYYILDSTYNIRERRGVRAAPQSFPRCKKGIIENIKIAVALSNNLKVFIGLDPTNHQDFLDNTSNFIHDNITDFTDVSNINKMVKLYLLCFIAKVKTKYLDLIPDIPRAQIQGLNTVIDTKIQLLNFESANLHTLQYVRPILYFMLYYLIKLFIQDDVASRVSLSILDIIKNIIRYEKNNIEAFKDGINIPGNTGLTQLMKTVYTKFSRLLYYTLISITELEVKLIKQLLHSPIKNLTSREYSTSSYKEAKYDETKIYDKCASIFKNEEGYFKNDIRKMKIACHKLFHPKHCGDVLKIRTDIYKYYQGEYPKIHKDDHEPLEITLKNTNSKIIQMFEYWSLFYNEEEQSIFERSILYEDGFYIRVEGLAGRGEGLTKNIFTEMAKSLLTEKIFIPIEENNKRHTINTSYKLIIDGTDKSEFIEYFWIYIGQFLQFCIINGITLDFYLSHTLLYILLETEDKYKPENVATYFILDHNDSLTKALVDTLNDEKLLEQYYDEFNDYKPLVKRNKKISKTNFMQFITMTAFYDLNKKTYDDPLSKIIGSFKDGFSELKHTNFTKVLRKNKVTIQTLDRLLSESNVTLENLKKFVATNFVTDANNTVQLLQCESAYETNSYINEDGIEISEPNPKYNPAHIKILENFKRIVGNGLRTFPLEGRSAKSSSESASNPEVKLKRADQYLLFMRKLFHFWSSNSQIAFSPHIPYKIAIINKPGHLPSAHTCFFTIDIPDDLTSYKQLYQKLITAVNNVESELGLL